MLESIHSFHIPVMGTAFTIDTPLKVARYGISSVISCVDDTLIEKMRRFWSRVVGEDYIPIKKHDHDSRANRITAYLNLVDRIVKEQVDKLKASAFEVGSEITRYFELLADSSPLKQLYHAMLSARDSALKEHVQSELREKVQAGSIDVNIMTKLDRTNFNQKKEPLPAEFSDALAALRGYANSSLISSVVFSAGFNGRLYSYVEKFKDFHADESSFIKKKIVVKVTDFRSALTQGKFFAKKGLWVSEYRLESGLNCGGHAFGSGGNLMGPSLEEFKQRKDELISTLFDIYNKARAQKGKGTFSEPHSLRITAQGGIGTSREHNFLLNHYGIDSAGWGTPFLLVPEATTTDKATLEVLSQATSEDLFLSNVSPLGVPFNNLRTSASELRRVARVQANRPGRPCIKGHLVSNMEFSEVPMCVASSAYQQKKLEQLQRENLDPGARQAAYEAIVGKSCLCNDLGGAAMLAYDLTDPHDVPSFPAVCPGPNLAFFTGPFTLDQMVDHIYGRRNILNDTPRPNMFISEIKMYIDFLGMEIRDSFPSPSEQRVKYLKEFKANLDAGFEYYQRLIPKMTEETAEYRDRMSEDLDRCKEDLNALIYCHNDLFSENDDLLTAASQSFTAGCKQ